MITVRSYEPGLKLRWNQFVQRARNPHFIFERDYLEYHADRFPEESLLFETKKGLVAILPAHRTIDPTTGEKVLASHDGLTFGGLIVGPSMHQNLMNSVFEVMLQHLRNENFQKLRYRAMPGIYSDHPGQEDLWCLHQQGACVVDRKVASIMQISGQARSSKSFRKKTRSAKKLGVTIERWENVEAFHDLLSCWLKDRHLATPVHTAKELRLLYDRFTGEIVILAAKKDTEILGAEMIFFTKNCVRLQYAVNTIKGLNLGISPLILENIFASLPLGKWIDLGTSMQPSGELNESLHAFKESNGARTLLVDTYELPIPAR